MSNILTIVGYALGEALRRRVFTVVLFLTVLFLFLFWLGNHYVFRELAQIQPPEGVDTRTFAGAFVFGMAMFASLFLGVVLAIFLTLGAVRGDAERGLLQPLVVRPIGRRQYLLGRFLGAAVVSAVYIAVVYSGAVIVTGIVGGWWPAAPVGAGARPVAAVVVVAALSLLGSVFLSSTANGIAVLMVFGAGLLAGLLGSIGDALNS